MKLRQYCDATDNAQMLILWNTVFGYEAAHNDPALVIAKKCAQHDALFFVAEDAIAIVGSVMAGYDGHRGWLYAVAVRSDYRGKGLGKRLVRHAEQALAALGCIKINLQLLASNESTRGFYHNLGYTEEPRISMGKLLPDNIAVPRLP